MDGLLTRRRAEELDAALSGAVPAPREQLAGDLAVVAALREAGTTLDAGPSPEFRDALRTRLMAVAAVQGVGATSPEPHPAAVSWRSRVATVTAGVTAGVVAVTGVAVASSQAVPGDAFYGLKRTTESLQLRLADGAREQGERHLQFAAERLDEARELSAGGDLSDDDTRRVREVLADMDADTRAGSQLLTEHFRASRDAEPLQLLASFAEQQRRGLVDLLPAVDGAGEDAVRESLALLGEVRLQAEELLLLVDCTTACDPTASAPVLPSAPLGSAASPPCECPTPAPAPSVAPPPRETPPATSVPQEPVPPAPTAPAPSTPPPSSAPASPPPSPSSGPLPTVPGVPLPSLPGVPTLPAPDLSDPLAPLDPLAPVPVPPLTGSSGAVGRLTDGLTGVLAQVGPALVVSGTGPAGLAVRWLRALR